MIFVQTKTGRNLYDMVNPKIEVKTQGHNTAFVKAGTTNKWRPFSSSSIFVQPLHIRDIVWSIFDQSFEEVIDMSYAGGGGGFALIVVLFILLIIVGAAWVY